MDNQTAKFVTSCGEILNELSEEIGGPFRAEMASMLAAIQKSLGIQADAHEKAKQMNVELDAGRVAMQEIRADEDEIMASYKQAQEDVARLSEEVQKNRLSNLSTENVLRETRARIAALEATKELGAGWTGDQLEKQAQLKAARDEATADLDARRHQVSLLRADVSLLASQLEAAATQKAEADAAIARYKEEITDAKTALGATQRGTEYAERELKTVQDSAMLIRHELTEKGKASEQNTQELSVAQEGLREDKARLDRAIKDFETMRAKAVKTADEVEEQTKINHKLAAEIHTTSEAIAVSRREAASFKREAEKLQKLHALTMEKIEEAEKKHAAVEERAAELRRKVDELDAQVQSERRRLDAKKTATDDARREKDVLGRTLSAASDKTKDAQAVLELQEAVLRNLQTEVNQCAAVLKGMRTEIASLVEERLRYSEQAEEAQKEYFTVLEATKLQELQMAALQRKIEEGSSKLKQQQTLYDAVKADRNLYSKNLADATAEIAEMKRQYRAFGHSIDSLKIDIEGKDASLVKVHFEHHRLEKEKDTLKSELTRIQKQVQSCEQILAAQEVEITKLNAIVFEADAEKVRQAKEYENVVSERNLLVSQLVKRDGELTSLYERLRVQKSMLANGASSYARYAAEREDLAARLAALKGELLVAKTQVGDTKALESEAKRLEEDLVSEKTKIRALTEELERPINIHRWRILADRQPEKWQTIQRIHALQKRVLDTKEELKQKEQKIAEQEKEYAKLKETLARQPGPEVADTVASYQATLKGKTKQLSALESELSSYRGRVDEYRRELQRINESMEALADEYLQQQKAQRKAQRQTEAAATMAANMRASGLDDASLLDVSKELLAAGLTNGSRMGTRQGVVMTAGGTSTGPIPVGPHQLIPEAVNAVKDEADALLAEYADVLGAGGGSGAS